MVKVNEHDMETAVTECCTRDYTISFSDSEFSGAQHLRVMKALFAAFPDFQLSFQSLTLGKDQDEPVIIMHGVIASGHHTGTPFQFDPYPAIEATGKYVENSPETNFFYFRDGKIAKIVADSSQKAGPANFYSQLTGGFPARNFFHACHQKESNKLEDKNQYQNEA